MGHGMDIDSPEELVSYPDCWALTYAHITDKCHKSDVKLRLKNVCVVWYQGCASNIMYSNLHSVLGVSLHVK